MADNAAETLVEQAAKPDPIEELAKQIEKNRAIERGLEPPQETPPATEVTPTDTPPAAEAKVETNAAAAAEKKYWETLGEKVGFTFQTEEQLIDEIKSGRGLKQRFTEVEPKLKEYESFSATARDIDRAEKAGIDINLYLEARNMDLTKVGDKEALRRAYLIENQDVVKDGGMDFAMRQFERQYKNKYSLIDTPQDTSLLDEEQKAQVEEKVLDAKDLLKMETIKAKRTLTEWKQKHVSLPEPPKPEDQEKLFQNYLQDVDKSVNELKTLDVPVGDQVFKFGVDGYKEPIKKVLSNPKSINEFFLTYGVDLEKGKIDPDKFKNLVLATYLQKDMGKPVSEWWMEKNNSQTLKSKLNDPAPAKPIAAGAETQKDGFDKFADHIEAKRKAERQ